MQPFFEYLRLLGIFVIETIIYFVYYKKQYVGYFFRPKSMFQKKI